MTLARSLPFQLVSRVGAAVGIVSAVIVAGSLVSSDPGPRLSVRGSLEVSPMDDVPVSPFTDEELTQAAALGLYPVGDALVNPAQVAGVKSHAGGVLVVFVGGGTVFHDGITVSEGLAAIRSAIAAAQASPGGGS